MNIALFSLLSAIVCCALGIYVYYLNPQKPLNRVFLLLCLSNTYCCFTEFMYRQAQTYETAYFWVRMGLLWPLIVVFLIHFTLLFTEKHDVLRNRLTYFIIYLPALFWIILDITTGSITPGAVKEYWGYTYTMPRDSWSYWASAIWAVILVVISSILCIQYYFTTTDNRQRKQAKYISIGLLFPIIFGIVTEVPWPGLPRLPELTSLGMTYFVVFAVYAIKKYELFSLKSSDIIESVIANIPSVIWVADTNPLHTIYMNPQGEKLYQHKLVEFQENPNLWLELVHPEDRKRISSAMESLFKEEKNFDAAYRILRPDGSIRWVYATARAIHTKENVTQLWGMVVDITKRKWLEEQFYQSQKMEAIGTLASGIAHDFNNLLLIIMGNLELLKSEMTNISTRQLGLLGNIGNAVQEGTDLSKSLLTFARNDERVIKTTNINDVIKEVVKILEPTVEKIIHIETHLSPDLWIVNCDSSQLYQVVLNICVNARDAMPKGGKITIETKNVIVDEDFIRTRPYAERGNFTRISISDTGVGMDKETLQHIFEPFFTTKEQGKGTGLGLAVIYGVVKNHKGFINVSSEKDKGSCFEIYLPVAAIV